MEGLRQALCMIYVALAEAAGGDEALLRANRIIRDGLDDGAIEDPVGARILARIVNGTERELRMIHTEKQKVQQHVNSFAALMPRQAA